MTTKFSVPSRRAPGFTLAEMMIVIAIIVVLAALTLGGYNLAMRGSKRKVTENTLMAVQSSLERYLEKFGEYPEPQTPDQPMQVMPGKSYNVGGARCLYQALRGDGFDAIKLAGNTDSSGAGTSDGNFSEEEIERVLFQDMPPTLWRKVSGAYILVDAFGNPFQYAKANLPATTAGAGGSSGGSNSNEPNTINATYDLWSFADDSVNIMSKSIDTKDNPNLGAKWIKNW